MFKTERITNTLMITRIESATEYVYVHRQLSILLRNSAASTKNKSTTFRRRCRSSRPRLPLPRPRSSARRGNWRARSGRSRVALTASIIV